MGYRSDVRMVIRGPEEVILREFANLRLLGDNVMQGALDEWHVVDINGPAQASRYALAILGEGGTNWKWYSDYPDVQAHTRVFEHFRKLHEDAEPKSLEEILDGAFVRLGEDTCDIDEEYFGESPYDLARPVRSIECSYDITGRPDLRPRLQKVKA